MSNSETIKQSKNSSKVSLKNGYHFYFRDGDTEIYAHGSAYSGKETIYVNDKKVSQFRNLGRKSVHKFSIGKDNYEIEFDMISILKGLLHCTLIKNGVHFKTLKLTSNDLYGTLSKFLLKSFIIGFITGFIVVKVMKHWF